MYISIPRPEFGSVTLCMHKIYGLIKVTAKITVVNFNCYYLATNLVISPGFVMQ